MIPRTNNDSPQARALTRKERKALEQFARSEVSLAELQSSLGEMLDINFGKKERRLTSYFLLAQPGIHVEKKFIQTAMEKHARGEISTKQLADWATVIQLLDAYDWQGPEEDQIADWLNEISMLTLEADTDPE
jgi:hypothetical protein